MSILSVVLYVTISWVRNIKAQHIYEIENDTVFLVLHNLQQLL